MATLNVTDREGVLHQIPIEHGDTVMNVLRNRDMVRAECGGLKICSTCHIFVDPEWYSVTGPATEDEVDLIDGTLLYAEGSSRLACQIPFRDELDGLKFTLAPEL